MNLKTRYKRALEAGRVFLTAENMTRNGITEYNLYMTTPKGKIEQITGNSVCWSETKHSYHVTAWGTSRPLEVILSVGYNLGLSFSEIKQNYRML